jgi:hypothetical protein
VGVGTSRKSSVMILPLRWWRVLAEGGMDGLVVVLGPTSLSGYSISRSGKEVVVLAVGAALGVVVGVELDYALVSTLSA